MASNQLLNCLIDSGRKPICQFRGERDAKVGAALFEAFAKGSAVETT